jgi:hypothetical protein
MKKNKRTKSRLSRLILYTIMDYSVCVHIHFSTLHILVDICKVHALLQILKDIFRLILGVRRKKILEHTKCSWGACSSKHWHCCLLLGCQCPYRSWIHTIDFVYETLLIMFQPSMTPRHIYHGQPQVRPLVVIF